MSKIKVIVVDDSALMRKIISDMINLESDMEVIDVAKNGEDLIKNKLQKNPDVITMDVEMPAMDGISTLKQLKKLNISIPVIMLSSLSKTGPKLTMDCLEAGAFDFIAKPSGTISLDINKVKDEVVEKIRVAYNKNDGKNKGNELKISKLNNIELNKINENNINSNERERPIANKISSRYSKKMEAIVIGASTGGPKALYKVITALPGNLGVPVFVVQHMPVGFTKAFADRLNANSQMKVLEAEDAMPIEKNVLYIAKGGFHMEVGSDKKIHLNSEPAIWGVRPAVDKLFVSASKVYKENILSVVLTGMGRDGAQGTIEIKKNGGITISEDASTCTIYGMPKAAYETGMVDEVVTLDNVANRIISLVMRS